MDDAQPALKKNRYATPEYFLEHILYPEIDNKALQIIPGNSTFLELGATNLQTVPPVDTFEDRERNLTDLSLDGVVPFLQVIGR